MAKSTFFRYLPARLKPLGKPAIWVPLVALTLIGAFLVEYRRNPDWFDRQPVTDLTPESRLTAEEEARLSEIDTLDVLLDGSRVSNDTPPVTSQINPDAPEDSTEGSNDNASDELSLQEAYPIPGTASTDSTIQPQRSSLFSNPDALPGRSSASVSRGSSNGTTFNFGDSLVNPAAPSTNSALADALNRREAARTSEPAVPSGNSSAGGQTSPTGAGTSSGSSQAVPPAKPVPGKFIRTTPEMSPPVGTTGYQAPATSGLSTFNIRPQQPTPNPFNASPNTNQSAAPAPANVAPPAVASPSSASPAGSLYTVPSSVQPDQGRPINPRR
ncbi:MAG: hypothetical protein WA901_19880 [Phormidesmis sp.]